MLCWRYEGLVRCLGPCWFLSVSIRELLLVTVGGHWHIYRVVIYSVPAHIGILSSCIVLAGLFLVWLSTWWVINSVVICQVWQCNVIQFKGISLFMINPRFWMDEGFPIAGWLNSWIGWICFGLGAKGGCVLGCALQTSVAPYKGEQPWRRSPRCCLPWFIGSMMFSNFLKTHFQSLMGSVLCLSRLVF